MVWDQGPGVALGLGLFEDDGEPFQKRLAVPVITKQLSSFYPPGHYVLEEAGSVKSGFAKDGLFFRQDLQDFEDFFVCIFNFQTKLKIPNRFAMREVE